MIDLIIWPRWTKWSLVEIYHFNGAYYSLQVRQNIKTGFKQFRCNKVVPAHYGGSNNVTSERIESLTEPKIEAPTCATCGSADTYTTTAYHCRRCATTTEI